MSVGKIYLSLVAMSLLVISACSSAPRIDEISDDIAHARTAADHLRIADYFAQKAASYNTEAAHHEQLSHSYEGTFYRTDPTSWIYHCQRLRDRFASAAEEARALERAHREMAAYLAN